MQALFLNYCGRPALSLFMAFFSLRSQHFLHVLLELRPWNEYAVFAADAFNADIHPHPDDLHFIRAARVLLLHLYNIAQFKLLPLHSNHPLSFLLTPSLHLYGLVPILHLLEDPSDFHPFLHDNLFHH